jgi:hypothetical protein
MDWSARPNAPGAYLIYKLAWFMDAFSHSTRRAPGVAVVRERRFEALLLAINPVHDIHLKGAHGKI